MDLRRTAVAALALMLFSCGGNEAEVTPKTTAELGPLPVEDAKNIFVLHCESCHGMDGKKKLSGAADLSISKLTDKEIKAMILNGNDKGMMPYKEIITDDRDVNGLVEFVKTLR